MKEQQISFSSNKYPKKWVAASDESLVRLCFRAVPGCTEQKSEEVIPLFPTLQTAVEPIILGPHYMYPATTV
jgi:hypothetical protein